MKDKDFFNQLDKELDRLVPPMSEKLASEPIITRDPSETGEEQTSKRVRRPQRRGLFAFVGVAAAAALTMAAVLPFALSPSDSSQYIVMRTDINPSVSLLLDSDYIVRGVMSNNDDGDALLSDEQFTSSLEGKSAQQAAVLISERAAKSGFIDVANRGSGEDYNRINVSLTADGKTDGNMADEIAAGLTNYFNGIGVYVLVDCTETVEVGIDLSSAFDENTLVYQRLDADEMEEYAAQAVYSFAQELLGDALERYDLYEHIYALNEQIADLNGGRDYWDITPGSGENALLCAEMADKLAKMSVLYDADYSSRAEFLIDYGAYMTGILLVDVDALKLLYDDGIDGENFSGIENFDTRLNYYNFIGNNVLKTVIEELFSGSTDTLDELIDSAVRLTEMRIEARLERFTSLFELERKPITEDDYAEFIARIDA